jgi:hypothetical protein
LVAGQQIAASHFDQKTVIQSSGLTFQMERFEAIAIGKKG